MIVETRDQRIDDEAFTFALFRETFDVVPLPLPPDMREILLRQQFAARDISYRAACPGAAYTIVERDHVPVGRIVTWLGEPRRCTIVDIAILSRFRGSGIGTRVMETVLAQAHAADRTVRLRVLATNIAGQRFYRRLGFIVEERTAIDLGLCLKPVSRGEGHRQTNVPRSASGPILEGCARERGVAPS